MQTKSLMELFNGGKLEHKIMGKSGCLDYATTAWEFIKPNVFERGVSYRFNRNVSIFGGEVACRQRKSPIANGEGWIIDEVMALQGVPFSDHFRVCDMENENHQLLFSPIPFATYCWSNIQ